MEMTANMGLHLTWDKNRRKKKKITNKLAEEFHKNVLKIMV